MKYYCTYDGSEVHGPYTLSEIQNQLATGSVPETAQVCLEGTESWQKISAIVQIKSSRYYCSTDASEVYGPFTIAELENYVVTGVVPATAHVCAEGQDNWQNISTIIPKVSSVAPESTLKETASPQKICSVNSEKSCPMCGEKILLAAKKCRHCGEYLEESLRPKANDKGIAQILVQSKLRNPGVAALLAFILPYFGLIYVSGELFKKYFLASFIVMVLALSVAVAGSTGRSTIDVGIFCVFAWVGNIILYIISIFHAYECANKNNNKIIRQATK